MIRHHHRDDDLFLHGWAKFFHNLAMLILYPLRKPLKFLLIVIVLGVLSLLPAYVLDLDVRELPEWYKEQKDELWQKASNKLQQWYFAYVNPEEEPVIRHRRNTKIITSSERKNFVEARAKKVEETQKKATENKKYSGDEIDVKYQQSRDEYENPALRNTGRKNPYYGTKSQFSLIYPQEITEVSGKAEIYNANELMVNDVYMFLFGIYTDPKSSNYAYAEKFLRETIENKQVRCEILAYTKQNIATAKCYVGAKCINDMLTGAGLSKKVF